MSQKVALVTGGGRGIGRSIAEALVAEGYAVALLGRDPANLSAAAQSLGSEQAEVLALPCDVTESADVRAALAAVENKLGPVSLLVNNAGIGDGGLIWKMEVEAWWRVQEVNLKGPLLTSHAVLPAMVARGSGRIINVGSFAANSTGKGGSAYSTSKAALQRLTEGIAADVAGSGVAAFCVSPGFVWTDMGREYDAVLRAQDPAFQGMDDKWVYPPEAVASLCMRLASGEADALSGCFIHVRDNLDEMIANSAGIGEQQWHQLRYHLPPQD